MVMLKNNKIYNRVNKIKKHKIYHNKKLKTLTIMKSIIIVLIKRINRKILMKIIKILINKKKIKNKD